jgi:hypothetical protein
MGRFAYGRPLRFDGTMAPKYHPTPLSGGDRKALKKELVKSRAMTGILAEQSEQKRRVGEALIREADNLACQSWNEKMWSDGGPIDPSPTIEQAINGGFPWLEIECSRCRAKRDGRLVRPATAADDMRARSCRAPDLSEVQSGWQASGHDAAPARAAAAIHGGMIARSYPPPLS